MRDNMPFGAVGAGEFGTYFIGYASHPEVTEQMLTHMFVGNPPGNYDRILDFSTPVTGTLFFVPTADFLDDPPPVRRSREHRPPPPQAPSINRLPSARWESATSRGAQHEQPAPRTRADLRRGLGRHRGRGPPHVHPARRRHGAWST